MLALLLLLSGAVAALALWLWLKRDRKYQSSESVAAAYDAWTCLLYTSPSPRDGLLSRMPSSA